MAEQREWKNGKPGKLEGQKLKFLLALQDILKHADADFGSASACFLFVLSGMVAIKHKFIGLPVRIFAFHNQKLLPF